MVILCVAGIPLFRERIAEFADPVEEENGLTRFSMQKLLCYACRVLVNIDPYYTHHGQIIHHGNNIVATMFHARIIGRPPVSMGR